MSVLSAMRNSIVFLMLLVLVPMMMLTLVVLLECLGHIHLHVAPMRVSAIHHHVVVLVRVALIIHAELLRRLRTGGSRRRGCVGVEGVSTAMGRRADAGGMVAVDVVCVMRVVVRLARSSLVGREVGHQRASRREYQPLPGGRVRGLGESPEVGGGSELGGRQARDADFSASEHGLVYNSLSYAFEGYGPPQVGM